MTPRWWWTRTQVLAQLKRWESEKDAHFERELARLTHIAIASNGMERAHIIKCLQAAVKTVERLS